MASAASFDHPLSLFLGSTACDFELVKPYLTVYKKVQTQVQRILTVIISVLNKKDFPDCVKPQLPSIHLPAHDLCFLTPQPQATVPVQDDGQVSLLPVQQPFFMIV